MQKKCDEIKDLKITGSGEIDTLKNQIKCVKDELKEGILFTLIMVNFAQLSLIAITKTDPSLKREYV